MTIHTRRLLVLVVAWLTVTSLAVPHALSQSGRSKRGSVETPPTPVPPRRPPATDAPVIPPPAKPTPSPTAQTPSVVTPPAANGEPVEANDADTGDDEVIDVRSNLVPVAASVIDAHGRPLVDLAAKDFELLVEGVRKPIAEVSRYETPVSMAILFDNSGSQRRARDLERQAAIRFLTRVMRPIDQAAIFSVSTTVTLEQPMTSNVSRLVRTIKRFGEPTGATRLLGGVVDAANYLSTHKGRRVIVIISDGEDTMSEAYPPYVTFDIAVRAAQVTDCQVYSVQTGYTDNANLRPAIAESRLQSFAAQTGGAVYTPQRNADLDPAFSQIAADLAQQYVINYYPVDEPTDGRFRRIAVRVLNRQNVRVRARNGYYAPKGG